MKKGSVVLLIGMLVCPMTLTAAEVVTEPSRVKEDSVISETIQSSEELFKETMASASIENEGYTESVQSTTSSEIEEIKTKEKELTNEDLLKYMEELALKAKTPEEYQEVLEYLKQHTDYNQVEHEGIEDIQAFSSRAAQKMGVAQFLGITKAQLLSELQKHEYDNFYLGTPFRGLWVPSVQCMSPNGAPNKYGPGFNCTGFVATAFQRAGGDLRRITNVANAWGDVCNAYNWRDALRPNTENYAFNSVNELLASGKAEKGDVIYFEPDYTKPGYDCHIGFFWGSRSNENLMWHSYDKNIKSNIKSATPFTKIYLFKLGNDKNAVQYDKQMNNERFVEKTNAAVYSRPYNTGDKSVDSMSGMYHNQVHVSREVKNGHGVWQEISYSKNGQKRSGWVQATELVDVIDRQKQSDKLLLNTNTAALYEQPYFNGVKRLKVLNNQRKLPIDITEKAKTGYGEWYNVGFYEGGRYQKGWLKTAEVEKVLDQRVVNREFSVNKGNGVVYDSPYTSSTESKKIGNTSIYLGENLKAVEEAYTGYGHWYRIESDILEGWVKETDLGEFTDFNQLNTRKIINKNVGALYDTPYVEGKTKKIGNLNNMLNQSVEISAVATTKYGSWYESKLSNNQKGWIKSTDLDDKINDKKIAEQKSVVIKNGIIYDSAYLGPNNTKEIGKITSIYRETVELDHVTTTGYGTWYHMTKTTSGNEVDGWIKSTDLANYIDYKDLNTRKLINKNLGALYDSPYEEGKTKKIGNLNNMLNQSVEISAVATTKYGSWYESKLSNNQKGWIKSTDLDDKIDDKKIAEQKSISNKNGVIYDSAYLGPNETKEIGKTTPIYHETVELNHVTTTGYGTWYHISQISSGKEINGWVKSTDLANYTDYQDLKTRKLINKNLGALYDSPYEEGKTKKIGNLTNMLNHSVEVSAVATTKYGTWYESKLSNNQKGWIKSTDLDNYIDYELITETKRINKDIGAIYDSPFISGVTKKIDNLNGLKDTESQVTARAVTESGVWFQTEYKKNNLRKIGWIKSTDFFENDLTK
ncbi:SH3-like domain-containing protein [Vagococcus fluvialis]|uniref:GW dipeptide domain-containing protein n=1 Tax=Vagococcus fluvialis TaxID=2738 RepID=UPI001A8CF699|nr:GW dipeptide domain-containing protein [Vagococcus fluvialis]MBO0419484.1 SH3-like domain-containing protein [Vagococcus fluvialis]